MPLDLQPLDYAYCALALVMAVTGLFRGLSGTLGFVVAASVTALAATFGWPLTEQVSAALPVRVGVALVGGLLTFGLVRLVVKKCVNGLLAQPTDAIMGFFVGALCAAGLLFAWVRSGIATEHSALATYVAGLIG